MVSGEVVVNGSQIAQAKNLNFSEVTTTKTLSL